MTNKTMVEGEDYTKSCGDVFEDLGLPSQQVRKIINQIIPETLKWISEKPEIQKSKMYGRFANHHEWEKNCPDAFDTASVILFQNNRIARLEEAKAALEAAYAVREADTVEVVTGEPEENDVGMDNRGNFARFTIYADGRSKVLLHWISENRNEFDEDFYRIIMRNGEIVKDKRQQTTNGA